MRQLNTLKKRMLLLLVALFSLGYAYAQIEVSGKLTGPDGAGLIGAEVREKGTNNGTMVMEDDGSWSLTVKGPESVLSFVLATYAPQERAVGSNRRFTVQMKPDAAVMQATVVIGYGASRPEDVTGGITQLTGSDVSKAPILAVDQALQGKAAGVQVRANSGSPGSGMDIVVRGRGTTGDARPLYVVDGVPQGNEWKGDPSNIESISILKDASSCAIYGARGANGVVLITTRGGNEVSGGAEYINVSFDAFMGGQETWKRIDVLSGDEYAQLRPDVAATLSSVANTDWQDHVFQKGLIDKFKITLDGGSAKTSWSASAGMTEQEGIVRGSGYKRYDAGYKGMWQLNKYIDLGANIGFNQSTQDKIFEGNMERSILGNALIAPPITPVYNASLVSGNNPKGLAPTAKYFNPVGSILYNDASTPNSTREGYGLGTGAWLNLKVPYIKGLEFKTSVSYGRWENDDEVYVPVFLISQTNNQQNPISFLRNTIQGGYNWNVSNTLSYSLNLYNEDSSRINHTIRLMAGHEALYEYQETYNVQISNVPESSDLRYPSMGSDPVRYWVEDYQYANEHTMLSYFGRAEYGFRDKYLINGTLRRDGSSRFGIDNKFGIFPSVGLAWKVNKEMFFQNQDWLAKNVNMLKIRGGWGKIGNANIANYLFVSSYGTDDMSGYTFGGGERQIGATPKNTINPDIMWEEATQWNLGADINLFKNKIVFNYDFFIKNNYNNLIQMSVPGVVGVDNGGSVKNPVVNKGTIRNQGSEFSLTYQNQYARTEEAKHVLHYSVSANFTINDNEVTGMEGGNLPGGYFERQSTYVADTKEGYPVAAFFGYKVDGIFQNWEEVNNGAQQDGAAPGNYKIADIDGDGKITTNDKTYIGNPHPKFSYGLNLDLEYAGFDLGLAFQGVAGNDIFNYTKVYLDGGYEMSNMSTRRLDVWSEENRGSKEPSFADVNWYDGSTYFPHSGFLEKGRYFRLKNITLGYTLPDQITEKLHLQKFRVYIQGQNLLTFTKYTGFDPEIGTNETENWRGPEFGIDRGAYPQARSVVGGVNITF